MPTTRSFFVFMADTEAFFSDTVSKAVLKPWLELPTLCVQKNIRKNQNAFGEGTQG